MTFKVTLNWKGEIKVYYTTAPKENVALTYAINKLAKELGVAGREVRLAILDPNHRRWEIRREK